MLYQSWRFALLEILNGPFRFHKSVPRSLGRGKEYLNVPFILILAEGGSAEPDGVTADDDEMLRIFQDRA
jgi:hypothetical protein